MAEIDRSDAVNLARNLQEHGRFSEVTVQGIAALALAVLAMDEYIRSSRPEAGLASLPEANELAAMARDARRYRWLKGAVAFSAGLHVVNVMERIDGDAVDRAVDASIARYESSPQGEQPK